MDRQILGVHHVSMTAGDPGPNLDFYQGLLGLRLVKLTVNYDDPGMYHLYYGDGQGRPGTILTFFPWPEGRPGRQGTGQTTAVALTIPASSLGYWIERLVGHEVQFDGPAKRFGSSVVTLKDPDGLVVELVASRSAARSAPAESWPSAPVPAEHAIRGVHSVTLMEDDPERTAKVLTEQLGFRLIGQEHKRLRFATGDGGPGALVDILDASGFWRAAGGIGTVHHVAWRTPDAAELEAWRASLTEAGFRVTPVRNRTYFQSIYFREPGGVLFEIATDVPGFTVDEPVEALGSRLMLPARLEERRAEVEAILPPLQLARIGE